MPEYARVCQSMPEYARVCQSMPEYARGCQSMQESCQSMPEYDRVCQSMPEYARVCQSMPEYARVCQSMPMYARVCNSMPKYARVCQSMPEDAYFKIFYSSIHASLKLLYSLSFLTYMKMVNSTWFFGPGTTTFAHKVFILTTFVTQSFDLKMTYFRHRHSRRKLALFRCKLLNKT